MLEYLRRFLNEQTEVEVEFPDCGTFRVTLLAVDSVGVAAVNVKTGNTVTIPFSSGALFTKIKEEK